MKIRRGFISNSSSSSFIVATDKDDPVVTVTLKANLRDYGNVLKTKDAVIEYFKDAYGDTAMLNVWEKNNYNKCLAAIASGKQIIAGSFHSDGDDDTERFLYEQGIPKDTEGIEIIDNEGGY